MLKEDSTLSTIHQSSNKNKLKYDNIYIHIILFFFVCFNNFSSTFQNSIQEGIETQLESSLMNLSYTQYNLLSSLHKLSGLLSHITTGPLIDKFGVSIIFLIGTFINLIGSSLALFGALHLQYAFLLFGNILLGLSSGPILVSTVKYIIKLFNNLFFHFYFYFYPYFFFFFFFLIYGKNLLIRNNLTIKTNNLRNFLFFV